MPAIVAEKNEALGDVIADYCRKASTTPTAAEYRLDIKCALESWPQALRDLSFVSHGFQITREQRDWLASFAGEHSYNDGPLFAPFVAQCDEQIAKFDSPPFFKFGTRSPKDSEFFHKMHGRAPDGRAVVFFVGTSWRAFEDLAHSQVHGKQDKRIPLLSALGLRDRRKPEDVIEHMPWVWFREYCTWKPWQEFRCFMRDGEFVGASQYHGVDPKVDGPVVYPALCERAAEYQAAIIAFFHEKFKPAIEGHMKSVVFDVVVDLDALRVSLIEINAPSLGTFPGLFNWRANGGQGDFDGELRWLQDSLPPTIYIPADQIAADLARKER